MSSYLFDDCAGQSGGSSSGSLQRGGFLTLPIDKVRLKQIEQEIERFVELPDRPRTTPNSDLKEATRNIILAFVIYRPDVGYIKKMGILAGTLLTYCEETDAFICFANLVHSDYFLEFFTGMKKDSQLRLDLFNDMLKS